MRFTVNIDCTPEEARTFFGLPDVKPMQDALMAQMQQQMETGLQAFGGTNIFQPWIKLHMDNLQQFQKLFLSPPAANNSLPDKKRA